MSQDTCERCLATSQIVSEGGLEPPRPYRAPGPQPGASATFAPPTRPSGPPGRRDTLAQHRWAPNRPQSLLRCSATAPATQEDAEQPQDRETHDPRFEALADPCAGLRHEVRPR